MKEEKLCWCKNYLHYLFNWFKSLFVVNSDFWVSKSFTQENLIKKIRKESITLLVFEYHKDLTLLSEVNDYLVFIDKINWEESINFLSKNKKYCMFVSSDDSLFFYNYLLTKGFNITKIKDFYVANT